MTQQSRWEREPKRGPIDFPRNVKSRKAVNTARRTKAGKQARHSQPIAVKTAPSQKIPEIKGREEKETCCCIVM